MRYQTILFDLDGTITDSGEGVMHGMEIVLRHYGLPVPDRQALRVIVGPPLRDSFLRFGVRPDRTEEAIALYREFYLAQGWLENFVYPGLEPLLCSLRDLGCKLYVATSKPEKIAVQVLEHFGLAAYFTCICGASEDCTRDSKSQVIAYLLDRVETGSSVVMIGDTHYDVQGAACFGIPTIGVAWGYGEVSSMEQAGALAVARDPQQLLAMLK